MQVHLGHPLVIGRCYSQTFYRLEVLAGCSQQSHCDVILVHVDVWYSIWTELTQLYGQLCQPLK